MSCLEFKEFARDKEVATINKVVIEMENNLNLSMDEDGNKEVLEVVLGMD